MFSQNPANLILVINMFMFMETKDQDISAHLRNQWALRTDFVEWADCVVCEILSSHLRIGALQQKGYHILDINTENKNN
jgi:arginine deiminase